MRTEESDLITEAELQAELAAIEAESIDWQPMDQGLTCTWATRMRKTSSSL